MLVPLEKKEKLSHASLEKDCEPGFGLKAHTNSFAVDLVILFFSEIIKWPVF